VLAQVFEERGDVLLRRRQQHAMACFEELGEGPQVAQIRFAGERAKASFHAQIRLVAGEQLEVSPGIHTPDYRRA